MACHSSVRRLATDAGTFAGSSYVVGLFVYYESIIAGGVYRYKMDQVTHMPLHVTEYPSPYRMFSRRQ